MSMLKGLKGKKDGKTDSKKDKKDVLIFLSRNKPRRMLRKLLRKRSRIWEILLWTWVSSILPRRTQRLLKRSIKFRVVNWSRNKLILLTSLSRRRRKRRRLNLGLSTKVTFLRLFHRNSIWTKSILSFRVSLMKNWTKSWKRSLPFYVESKEIGGRE